MVYLDFESDIEQLETELEKVKEVADKTGIDATTAVVELEKRLLEKKQQVYGNLSAWQKVQVSRHPERPYTIAYMDYVTGNNWTELHGDRNVADDKAMVGGLGKIDGQPVMMIGQQKGINTKMRQIRRFGMANPEGYRKALRLMRMAEKFNIPIVTFIDTPGAYPGLEAEERGQGEAIARNLFEMFRIKVPIICVIIGEGASGGALGIGIGDKVLMLENTWYSVISPESCSSILWRNWEHKEEAAEALKLTANDMLKNKLIDGIIKEPLGGAHRNLEEAFENVKKEIVKQLASLKKEKKDKLIQKRIEKFAQMGVYTEK